LFAESVAGLKWTPPAGWKSSGTTSMRAATYPVAPVQGDRDVKFTGPAKTMAANQPKFQQLLDSFEKVDK